MFKTLLITTTVLLTVVAIRRWGVLNTVKKAIFNKVDELIGMVGSEPVKKETKEYAGSAVGTTPNYM